MTRLTAGVLCAGTLSLIAACAGTTGVQPSSSCDLTISPGSQVAPPSGGSFRADVTSSCAWSAASDDAWIAVNDAQATGAGAGAVTFTVQPNGAEAERHGRVRVGQLARLVTQAAGDSGSVRVKATGV
jgi:hypothetical protein